MQVTDAPSEAMLATLETTIDEHNMVRTGRRDYRPLAVFETDDRGALVADLSAFTCGGWLEAKLVWLREDQRGRARAGVSE